MTFDLLASLRPASMSVPESGIVRLVNHGRTKEGLIPLWVGEGDMPTPAFISKAAHQSLEAGETFYTAQRGIPELREALADYHTRHFGRPFSSEEMFVVGSGMQALQIAVNMTAGDGDEVVIPSPAWPNMAAAVQIAGGTPVFCPMSLSNDGWSLDLDRLFGMVTEKTRALFINTPSNPTGWVAEQSDLEQILNFARQKGIWIIADEIYSRFYYGTARRAPSFHDIRKPGDQILFVNSFSKNWAMTGWRIGWMVADPSLGQVIENLVQYSTSGVPVFNQRGAVAALNEGEALAEQQIERAEAGRAIVDEAMALCPSARFVAPKGAFYGFISLDEVDDIEAIAFRLVDEANVGLAPGTAFGPGGETSLRLCFLRDADQLREGCRRLVQWLNSR
ncbi:pyridoxal phosphate-dependent aminotransferase [Coralliovum pocilloporae]|uniref:pyridoxal phosphate-dependent aminotransferase n=1 Tax=Coralliovum pocilloporae TaxID=3066369 RepID=UPI003307B4F4